MANFKLSLTTGVDRTDGTFVPYSNMNAPAGRVWYRDGQVVPGSRPDHPGDPDFTVPKLRNSDLLSVEIKDAHPDQVATVLITVVFCHMKPREGNPPPFVSPFPGKGQDGVTFHQAVFSQTQHTGATWSLVPMTVSFGPKGRFMFEFAVGAVVIYMDGSIRHFGLDPEMDVENDPPGPGGEPYAA